MDFLVNLAYKRINNQYEILINGKETNKLYKTKPAVIRALGNYIYNRYCNGEYVIRLNAYDIQLPDKHNSHKKYSVFYVPYNKIFKSYLIDKTRTIRSYLYNYRGIHKKPPIKGRIFNNLFSAYQYIYDSLDN